MLFLIDLLYAFKKNEVNEIYNPSYRELAVKNVYPELKGIELLMRYFPDYPENILPERSFKYAILSTLSPNNMKNLITDWRKARCIYGNSDQQELVDVAPEILEEINNILLHPSKDFQF